MSGVIKRFLLSCSERALTDIAIVVALASQDLPVDFTMSAILEKKFFVLEVAGYYGKVMFRLLHYSPSVQCQFPFHDIVYKEGGILS